MAITYTLLPSHVGSRVRLETQDFQDVNVLVGSTAQSWSNGDVIEVYNEIDVPFVVTLVGDTGVTLSSDDGLVIERGTYARVSRASATRWDVHIHKARTPVGHLSDVVLSSVADGDLLVYRPDAGVAYINVTTGGSNYVDGVYPNVEFFGNTQGGGLLATVYVDGGAIVAAVPTSPGSGFILPDTLVPVGNIDGVGNGINGTFEIGALTTTGSWHNEAAQAPQYSQAFSLIPLVGMFFSGSFNSSWTLTALPVTMPQYVTYGDYFNSFTFQQQGLYRIDVQMRLAEGGDGWPTDNTEYGLQISTHNGAQAFSPTQLINHRAAPDNGNFTNETSMFSSFLVSSNDNITGPFGHFQLAAIACSYLDSGNAASVDLFVTVTRIAATAAP